MVQKPRVLVASFYWVGETMFLNDGGSGSQVGGWPAPAG